MRHKKAPKREARGDIVYSNNLVEKFINSIMRNGKKIAAQKAVYGAIDAISKNSEDPVSVFEKAIQNVGPAQEVRPRRVGGASYQIPIEVRGERRTSLAIRWIIQAARTRSSKDYHTFSDKLAAELLDAAYNKGEAVRKRDNVLRMAQANRAFAHFRW